MSYLCDRLEESKVETKKLEHVVKLKDMKIEALESRYVCVTECRYVILNWGFFTGMFVRDQASGSLVKKTQKRPKEAAYEFNYSLAAQRLLQIFRLSV